MNGQMKWIYTEENNRSPWFKKYRLPAGVVVLIEPLGPADDGPVDRPADDGAVGVTFADDGPADCPADDGAVKNVWIWLFWHKAHNTIWCVCIINIQIVEEGGAVS